MGTKIRIAERMSPDPTEEELSYFQHMGIDAATIWTTLDRATFEYMASIKELLEAWDIELLNIGVLELNCDSDIVLGLKEFPKKIEQYKKYIQNLGRAGIGYTTYAHMANIKIPKYYQTGVGETRGLPTREFILNEALSLPLSHGRFIVSKRCGKR